MRPLPHDRDTAIRSVTGDSPALVRYELEPLTVRVYDATIGVVHYRYKATVQPQGGIPVQVIGRWTEVYTSQGQRWLLVTVSGRPDPGTDTRGAVAPTADPFAPANLLYCAAVTRG